MSRSLLKFSGGHSLFRLLPDRTLVGCDNGRCRPRGGERRRVWACPCGRCTRRKDRSASSMPAATQRFFIEPSFQRGHPAGGAPGDRDHRLDAVGVGERLGQCAADAEAADGEHVLQALAQRGCGIGVVGFELVGQALGRVEALGRVGLGEDEGQAPVDGARPAPWAGGRPNSGACAMVHRCTCGRFAEDLLDPGGQRLGAVDDAEHAVLGGRGPGPPGRPAGR